MAAYCAVPPDDPFAVSKGMLATLAAELSGPAAATLTAFELEELLEESGREVIRQLLQDHFDLRKMREEQRAREQRAPAAGPDGITRTRLETGHGRLLSTLFGTVTVTRCAWRAPGAPNYCQADAALSLPAGRHSHSLAKLAAIEAARGSFDAAHAAIARRCGNVIGKRQLEQAVVHPRSPAHLGRPGRRRRAPAGPHPRRGRPPERGHPRRHRPDSCPRIIHGTSS